MDANKRVPAGSVRVYGVITLKEAGDFVKIKEKFQAVIENSHKEEGMISGEPFLKEGDTPETATQVYLISLWKSKESLDAHLEKPHTKEFFAAFKEMGATAEVTRLHAAL